MYTKTRKKVDKKQEKVDNILNCYNESMFSLPPSSEWLFPNTE
jgi:hypothetical protein